MSLPWLAPVWSQFLERERQGRLAHALLLTGPRGIGKATLAREMAAYLLCLEPAEAACGKCRSCQILAGGAHPEWFLVTPEEGKRQILIDQVRKFTNRLMLTTTISPRKAAVFVPAEAMNISSANALLKSLEEPQGDTVMILVSHDASRLPVTIRSRCQGLVAHGPDRDTAVAWLQEQHNVEPALAQAALDAAGGSPLEAADMVQAGEVEQFSGLQQSLAGLRGRAAGVSATCAQLAEIDPIRLWNWLSLSAAEALKKQLGGGSSGWTDGQGFPDTSRLARLQQSADRNRYLAGLSVRKDLLLQEWLLEWATQPG